jgi:hypothetical protein
MDLIAENRVITPSVMQTAPPIRIAGPLVNLFELPSYNIYIPRNKRVADSMLPKNVDTLLIGTTPSLRVDCGSARHHRGAE